MAKQYFLTSNSNTGEYLAVTGGTASSTKSLVSLNGLSGALDATKSSSQTPVQFSYNAFAYGSNYFFTAVNKNGNAAYSTDGNSVYNLDPAVVSPVTDLSATGSFDGVENGQAFLAADGTPLAAFPARLAGGDQLYQIAFSDGTGAGTKVVTAINVNLGVAIFQSNLLQSGKYLYFENFSEQANTQYATDGASTTVISANPGSDPNAVSGSYPPIAFTTSSGQAAIAYIGYLDDDGQGNHARTLTVTTGQAGAGTKQFAVSATSSATPPRYYEFAGSGSNVYLGVDYYLGPNQAAENRLVSTDGSTEAVVRPDAASNDYNGAIGLTPFTNAAGQAEIAFIGQDKSAPAGPGNLGRDYQIYVTTGSLGRTAFEASRDLKFDIASDPSGDPAIAIKPVVSGSTVYFVAQPRVGGNQIYATNGGAAVRLDPNAGSATPTVVDAGTGGITPFINAAGVAGVAFFANTSTTGVNQYQLLTSNGLAGGTRVAAGYTFANAPQSTVISNSRVFFIGQDNGSNRQAYASDGTTVTRLSPASLPGGVLDAGNLTTFTTSAGINGVAFSANVGTLANPSYQVFVSDGTTTTNVTAGGFTYGQAPTNFVANGGNVFWSALDANGYQGIYSSDGSAAVRDDSNPGGTFQQTVAINVTGGGISARNAVQPDAKSGTTSYTFNVERSGNLTSPVTFSYAVTGSGANPAAAALFGTPLTGTVSFAQGQSMSILTVGVKGQALSADAGFTVTVRGLDGYAVPADPRSEPSVPVYVLSSAGGTIQQNATAQPNPTPAPTPAPTPTPTPSANPSVAAFVAANVSAGTYNTNAIALASAGLGALAGASGTVVGSSSGTGAFAAPVAGNVNAAIAANPAAGSTVALPSGYGALVAQGGNPVTLSDAGTAGAVLVGNTGATTFNSTGTGVSLVGGPGANRFNVSGSATVSTGDGTSTVAASGSASANVFTGTGGSTVVLAGGGGTVQGNGQDTVFGGSGAVSITAAKGLVAVGGDGAMTFAGGSATSIVFGGKGVIGYKGAGGYDIVVGGSGGLQGTLGAGGGQLWGNGAGGVDVLAATGATTNVLVANNGGTLTSAGGAGNFLVAGGSATLDGSKNTGNDVFFGGASGTYAFQCGTGQDLIGTGTGTSVVNLNGSQGTTVFAFGASTVNAGTGSANVVMGGTVTLSVAAGGARNFALFNFVPGTDKIALSGYDGGMAGNALATQANGSGQTVLTLADKTTIQLVGVARADSSFFA